MMDGANSLRRVCGYGSFVALQSTSSDQSAGSPLALLDPRCGSPTMKGFIKNDGVAILDSVTMQSATDGQNKHIVTAKVPFDK